MGSFRALRYSGTPYVVVSDLRLDPEAPNPEALQALARAARNFRVVYLGEVLKHGTKPLRDCKASPHLQAVLSQGVFVGSGGEVSSGLVGASFFDRVEVCGVSVVPKPRPSLEAQNRFYTTCLRIFGKSPHPPEPSTQGGASTVSMLYQSQRILVHGVSSDFFHRTSRGVDVLGLRGGVQARHIPMALITPWSFGLVGLPLTPPGCVAISCNSAGSSCPLS